MFSRWSSLLLLIGVVALTKTEAFTLLSSRVNQERHVPTTRFMAPKFIGNKWIGQTPDDMPSAGYDVLGTVLRQGPEPALTRIFNPDDYEQAVLKFMASEKCDRNTAQGNMDAYLRNPPDWTFIRMEDEKRGYVRDYVTLQPKEIAKVSVWSAIVFGLLGRTIYCGITGSSFNWY